MAIISSVIEPSTPCRKKIGNFSEETALEWQAAEVTTRFYGVPQGCVVRNTFLEFNDCDAEICEGPIRVQSCGSVTLSSRPGTAGSIRRSKSCPEHFSSCADDAQPRRIERACTEGLACEAVVAAKLTADKLEVNSESETSPGSTRGIRSNGSWLDQEDGSEDRNSKGGDDDEFEDSKWTSFSSRRAKSRREQDFDEYGNKEGKGKGKGRDGQYDREQGGASEVVLTLRGLPFQTTLTEVTKFIDKAGCRQHLAEIARPIVLLTNPQGRPSGFAEIHLARFSEFSTVRNQLHMRYFGQRYVEVLPLKQAAPTESRSDRYDRGGRRERDRGARTWRR